MTDHRPRGTEARPDRRPAAGAAAAGAEQPGGRALGDGGAARADGRAAPAADSAPGTAGGRAPGRGRVAGLLLAAGGGRRLGGRPKALLPYRGGLLVEHAVEVLRAGGCGPVHVVLGAQAERVRERAPGLAGCTVAVNERWESGMGSSLRVGLDSLTRAGGADAVLVLLVDQPGIGPEAVARVRAHGARDALAAAAYGGRRGHPVLFGAERWAEVAASAAGDRGARAYLAAHEEAVTLVECGDVAEESDIDTPGDLRHLR